MRTLQKNLLLLSIVTLLANTTFIFPQYQYPYECVYSETPEKLKEFFFSHNPGGKMFYYGTDRFGRYLVCQERPDGIRSFIAIYEDEKGELWPSLLDMENKKETPFVFIRNPKTGDYEACHPDTLSFISKESILYPPKDMPRLDK